MSIEERAEQYCDKVHAEKSTYTPENPRVSNRYSLLDVQEAYIAGYNDALEEIQKNGLALQSDMDKTIEQNFALKRELEKVNKWHKVADGDLPNKGVLCAVLLVNNDLILARLREDNVWTTNEHNAFENVIAWCEIPRFTEE